MKRSSLSALALATVLIAACEDEKPKTILDPGDADIDGGEEDGGESDGGIVPPPRYCEENPADESHACSLDADGGAGGCDDGETCVPGSCPEHGAPGKGNIGFYCVPSGSACETADDCCDEPPCGDVACSEGGTCLATGDDACVDWRTCPWGYDCEDGDCVDRRVGCASQDECPAGFTCARHLGSASPFCQRTIRMECESDADCPTNADCVEFYSDGKKRCFYRGSQWCEGVEGECKYEPECDSLADCADEPEGQRTCGLDEFGIAKCGAYGLCESEADCPDDWSCADVHGDGFEVCLPPNPSCESDRDCETGGIGHCLVSAEAETSSCRIVGGTMNPF